MIINSLEVAIWKKTLVRVKFIVYNVHVTTQKFL